MRKAHKKRKEGKNEKNTDGKSYTGQGKTVKGVVYDDTGYGEHRVNEEGKTIDLCGAFCEECH